MNGLPVFIQQFPIVILVVNLFHCLVLVKLNGKIEQIRDEEDKFAKTVIEKFDAKENVVKDEKHNHFNVFKNETKQNFRKTLKGNSKNLATLTGQQTAIISEATLSKKAEVYLEASPQAILQLYIIAITGAVSTSQVVTIVVSLFVTTFGTMTTFLKEPTKVSFLIDKHIFEVSCTCLISNMYITFEESYFVCVIFQRFPIKEYDWRDLALTFVPTLALTLPRQIYLVLLLSYLKKFALALIALEVLILLCVAAVYSKADRSKAFIGAIASVFGPCFRVDEQTSYYLATGLTSGIYSFLVMLFLPMCYYGLHVYKDALFDGCVPEPLLFEKNCTKVTNLNEFFEYHNLFGYWYYLGITLIWTISLLATWFLHAYMKLSFRYRLSKWIHLNICRTSLFNVIWPTADLIWYPLLNGVLSNKDYYEDVNEDAKEHLGISILGYCLKSGHQDIGKVRKVV